MRPWHQEAPLQHCAQIEPVYDTRWPANTILRVRKNLANLGTVSPVDSQEGFLMEGDPHNSGLNFESSRAQGGW